ncbi:Acb2/Tad1 domain-containing protein [Myroides odoratus]|uniref:Acb2/Tad1 domain-containing protein n=1 Tax=Myroides odoratus TaxID=256 RepID=UPI000765DBB8|nr:hypothetical protein [Myroides odoratus]
MKQETTAPAVHDARSKGEQIIGRFNNENRESVDLIKQKASELVNLIEEYGKDPRRKAAAITDIEKGTMMAVKSLFES